MVLLIATVLYSLEICAKLLNTGFIIFFHTKQLLKSYASGNKIFSMYIFV